MSVTKNCESHKFNFYESLRIPPKKIKFHFLILSPTYSKNKLPKKRKQKLIFQLEIIFPTEVI